MTGGRVVVLGPHRAQLRRRHERRHRLRARRGRRRSARASTRRCSISSRSSTTPTRDAARARSPSTSSAPARRSAGACSTTSTALRRRVRQGLPDRLQARARRACRRRGRRRRRARPPDGRARRLPDARSATTCATATRASASGDYKEFLGAAPDEELAAQGARCMDCGVPFCHNGCPLGNLIPDWNDLVYRDRWREAIAPAARDQQLPRVHRPAVPGAVRGACVLEINEGDAVTIKQIENSIIDRAWDEGWVVPQPPAVETGRTVAVVGAGPAGMAAAQQLRRAGHRVVLFERDEAAGGLVRFGVPDFKIEKYVVERRVAAARRRGRRVPLRRRRRRRRDRRRAARAVRRGRAGDRLARAARPAGPGPRARRRALRDGVPVRAQPRGRGGRRRPGAGRRHQRRGQARRRHRRRRHRRRLRRQLDPRGRAVGRPARAAARAAGEPPRRPHAVAAVAAEVPPLLRDGGGAWRSTRASRTSRS